MLQTHLPAKRLLLVVFIVFISAHISLAQAVYLPYSYQSNQKYNADIYSLNNSFHTSLKPYLIDSTLSPRYNKLMQLGVDSSRKSWVNRILFNQHLIEVKNRDFTFYADYLPDLQVGKDTKGQKSTNLNTRGYQLGGTVGSKFSFYSSGFENSGVFPTYYQSVTDLYHFVPGQSYDRSFGKKNKDWSYATAIVSYTPIKQLNITLGTDKTFIGDGYRSLLLSDNAAPYPLLRLTANVGHVQYMLMWSYLEDTQLPKYDDFGSNRRKWGLFHYLDWNVNNRLSVGFFNALIAAEADDNGNLHGFDLNYINPLILTGELGPSKPVPDNVLFGGTAKYKILDKTALYGQIIADNSYSPINNTSGRSYGYQLGLRGTDVFGIKNLNYIFEYNTVKPDTYIGNQPIVNYTQYSEPLGDPLGTNFREIIGIINYSLGRLDLQGQVNSTKYVVDVTGLNTSIPAQFTPPINPGTATNLFYAEGTASYLLNPKYNLRLEVGALYRDETNTISPNKTMLFTFGLRSTFRSLYHDF